MQKLHKLTLTLNCVLILQCYLNMANAEYKIVLNKMTKEIETTTLIESNLKFHGEESIIVSGELKQIVDLDDNWKIRANISRADKADGEYAPFMDLPPKGVCEMLKSYYKVYFYDSIKENIANAPAPTECPVLQRTYVFKDYVLQTSKFQKFIKPGYYSFIVSLAKDDEDFNTYVFEAHVEETH